MRIMCVKCPAHVSALLVSMTLRSSLSGHGFSSSLADFSVALSSSYKMLGGFRV